MTTTLQTPLVSLRVIDVPDAPPALELAWAQSPRNAHRVPIACIDIHTRMEQRDCRDLPVALKRAARVDDQLHLELFSRAYDIAFSLWLGVRDDGSLQVCMPIAELCEKDHDVHRLLAVHVLPGLMSIQSQSQGLLSLSAGRQFAAADAPAMDDRYLIYGQQSRWELLPILPMAAVSFDQTHGLCMIATGCAEDTLVRVRADGAGHAQIDAGFSLREAWPDVIDPQDRVVRFTPLRTTPDLLHAAADVMRRHITQELHRPTLQAMAAQNAQVRQMLESYTMKMFFALQHDAHDPQRCTYRTYMSFDQAGDTLARIKQAGIDHVITQAVGFIEKGHDGSYPSHCNIDRRLGGPEGFARLLARGHELGFAMNVHDNYNEAYRSSADFDEQHLFVDEYGEYLRRGRWGGGQAYLVDMLNLPHRCVEGELAKVKALGLTGMGYVDAVGNPLYRNHDPRRPSPRSGHARGIARVLDAARQVHGAVGIECGFLYALLSADSFVMPGSHRSSHRWQPDWPLGRIAFERVPLVNLVCSGLWTIETDSHPSWTGVAESLLLGRHPRTEWAAEPGMRHAPPVTDERLARYKAIYDLQLVKYASLQTQRLMRWQRAGDDVEQTTFEDGTCIELDYATGRLHVDSQPVAMPACFESQPLQQRA